MKRDSVEGISFAASSLPSSFFKQKSCSLLPVSSSFLPNQCRWQATLAGPSQSARRKSNVFRTHVRPDVAVSCTLVAREHAATSVAFRDWFYDAEFHESEIQNMEYIPKTFSRPIFTIKLPRVSDLTRNIRSVTICTISIPFQGQGPFPKAKVARTHLSIISVISSCISQPRLRIPGEFLIFISFHSLWIKDPIKRESFERSRGQGFAASSVDVTRCHRRGINDATIILDPV